MTSNHPPSRVLLTGATGYVGGRLLPLLLSTGRPVRCLTRRASSEDNFDGKNIEVVVGNALDEESLIAALKGVETAYYLIHSMGDNEDFEQTDRRAAENFAKACTSQGVKRIVYLGGLGDPSDKLSKHLRSRQEIGDILRTSTASVIEFQASIIIGSGSLSFEMIRALVERLPVMICPKWVRVVAQPIAFKKLNRTHRVSCRRFAFGNHVFWLLRNLNPRALQNGRLDIHQLESVSHDRFVVDRNGC